MASVCCALCGSPISRDCPEQWLKEFKAVYTKNDQWNEARLSGTGVCSHAGMNAPIEPTRRHGDPGLQPDSSIPINLLSWSFKNLINPDPFFDEQPFWGFGFHLSCWTLLTELFRPQLHDVLHACLSMPFRTGGILDWGHDYGGVVRLRSIRGRPIWDSRYYLASREDPVRFDPLDVPTIHHLPQSTTVTEDDDQTADTGIRSYSMDVDCFMSLPTEILHTILISLQTTDVRSLRLASPTFANMALPEAFWASRCSEGHEYHHVFEVRQSKPRSWKAIYDATAMSRTHPGMINRKRIWGLAIQLRRVLEQVGGICHGRPLRCYFESSGDEDNFTWQIASRGLQGPESVFNQGSRALRSRAAEISVDIERLFISFVQLSNGKFVSGIRVCGNTGGDVRIGFIHPNREVPLHIPSELAIHGWHLAFHETGIKAIAALMEDGSLSAWVGEHEGVPKRRLAGNSTRITTIKTEFDSVKLVSLSIPSLPDPPQEPPSLRDISLWSPEIPAEHFLFNGSEDDFPVRKYSRIPQPFSTVIFGGDTGQDLSQLVEIVGWVFDVYDIVGLQFFYADTSKNKSFGRVGPFEAEVGERQATESEDFRMPFSIDGPGGERVSHVQIQGGRGVLYGLMIKTNFGREMAFPPDDARSDGGWTAIQPSGNTVVGFYSVLDRGLDNMGLIFIHTDSGRGQ